MRSKEKNAVRSDCNACFLLLVRPSRCFKFLVENRILSYNKWHFIIVLLLISIITCLLFIIVLYDTVHPSGPNQYQIDDYCRQLILYVCSSYFFFSLNHGYLRVDNSKHIITRGFMSVATISCSTGMTRNLVGIITPVRGNNESLRLDTYMFN